MVKWDSSNRKIIAYQRLRFFIQEVALAFIIIFIFLLTLLLESIFIEENTVIYGIIFYVLRAIIILFGIPLSLYLSNLIFESQKRNKLIVEEDISPAKGHLRLYSMTKKNYKYQILYGLLIFFLVFLPLDFFTYLLIPEMIEYHAWAFTLKSTDGYLILNNYFLFLISAIIIQVSVSFAEETISRGFLTKRGSEHFLKTSAVMISALYFGLGHFAYFIDQQRIEAAAGRTFPFWFPFLWFTQAFILGLILSLLILRRKWLFPVILAHALNNIISTHTIWNFIQGGNFKVVAFHIYLPLLIIGLALLVWQFPKIKEGVSIGLKMIKPYFENDEKLEKTKGDKLFRIFIDVIVGILISLLGTLILI